MQTEIDKIEAELDNVSIMNIELSQEMKSEQDSARKQIKKLRGALAQGQLTQSQLAKAQEEIKELKNVVSKYSSDMEALKKINANLTTERNDLKSVVDSVSFIASDLEKQNEELSTKVKAVAALKTSNISVQALNVKNSGKENNANRANTTDKLRINFSLVNNPLGVKGMHNIYLRVIDPSGNLISTKITECSILMKKSYNIPIKPPLNLLMM